MTEDEARVEREAIAFAKAEKKRIARRLTDPAVFPPEEAPVSVFMAGSPGAGKTEAAIELISALGTPVIRIDVDDLRSECPGYGGGNAWLYQRAASILVEKVHDMALDQEQSFVLDSTFSNYDKQAENVRRSLKRRRKVQILYVYQEPSLAWKFVQAREAAEGRRVPPEQFVDQYFASREVANRIKREFGKDVSIDLLMKNVDNSHRSYRAGVDQIDYHIPERFTREEVEQIAKAG